MLKAIEKEFKRSTHRDFQSVQQSLTELLHQIKIASKNNYQCILNSNAWGKNYHKLTIEELFLMNLSDKDILAILNISIYNAIAKDDYNMLMDGVFTYTRLRFLNRTYLSGTNDWVAMESLIANDKELLSLVYPQSLTLENDLYDYTYLLSSNLLRTILYNRNFGKQTFEQYVEYIDKISAKFDVSFLKYLYALLTDNDELCKISFEQMEQLHSRCQWLARGWYQEATMTKILPVFLLGAIQLRKYTNTNLSVDISNEYLKNARDFIVNNPDCKHKLVMEFKGEISFLNVILTNHFIPFYEQYKYKMENEIKR